jgi:alpha-beta hydrolase superfamily lysophospholipase
MENHLLPFAFLLPDGRRWWRLLVLFTLVAPPLAAQPTAFTQAEVTFGNADVTLGGTVFKPRHPVAAVVLVHGPGQEKRLLGLATQLAQRSIAVLMYDKRGVRASGGVYVGPEVGTNNVDAANLDLLAAAGGPGER